VHPVLPLELFSSCRVVGHMPDHPIVVQIHVPHLHKTTKSVCLRWALCYRGLPGDRVVDAATKDAALCGNLNIWISCKEWSSCWSSLSYFVDLARRTGEVKPSLYTLLRPFLSSIRMEAVISRLPCSHTRLALSPFWRGGRTPVCLHCGPPLTLFRIRPGCQAIGVRRI
jgi:hypothetical protein